jgi:hypothetical protein
MRKYILFIIILIVTGILNLECINLHSGGHIIFRSGEVGDIIRIIPIWIDWRFTTGEKESIKEGIAEWDNGLNGWMKLRVIDEEFNGEDWKIKKMYTYGGWAVVKVTVEDLPILYKWDGESTLGYVDEIGGNIISLVEARLSEDMIKYVIMHEAGHLLGLGHDGKHLMGAYYSRNNFRCIDEGTMERVGKIWNIRKGLLNFCERI